MAKKKQKNKTQLMRDITCELFKKGIFISLMHLSEFDVQDLKYISDNAQRLIPEIAEGVQVKLLGFDKDQDCVNRMACT